VYDMYPWDARGDGPRTRPPAPRDGNDNGNGTGQDLATHAVQVALDRRDNGGDSTDIDADSPDADSSDAAAAVAVASRGRK
jgi:hypothetical protein